jgi:hypothetical protein
LSLRDVDKTAEENAQILQPIIVGPSSVFVTSSHYYNAFQEGNRDSAVKADKNAQKVRLLVDFTSIKDFEKYISINPKVFFSFHDLENNGKLVSVIVGDAKLISPGLYYAERDDMKEGEVIRIEFSTDFDTTSNIS